MSFLGMQVLLTGSGNFKDIQNSRQNCFKNKLVRENAVTRAHGSCSLQVMGSCYEFIAEKMNILAFDRIRIQHLPLLGSSVLNASFIDRKSVV